MWRCGGVVIGYFYFLCELGFEGRFTVQHPGDMAALEGRVILRREGSCEDTEWVLFDEGVESWEVSDCMVGT
jgi:hypothetical protein